MADTLTIGLVAAAAFVTAGFVKGVVGMGLPTVAMGLLGLIMSPLAAAGLLVIPSLVTNLWQLFAGPAFGALTRRLASMMLTLTLGTALGIGVLTGSSTTLASAALGAILAVYGALGLSKRQFTVPRHAEPWLSPVVGLLTGLITGATGVFAIPAVPYLNSMGLDKEAQIQALGLSFTVSTLALAGGLALSGSYPWVTAGWSLWAILPALLGMHLGQKLRNRLDPAAFKRWFFIGLMALGLSMLVRAGLR